MLTCRRLRTAVLLSAIFFVAGLVLGVIAHLTALALPVSHLALLLVLSAVLVLALTFLASLLPGSARRLSECSH